MRWAIAVVLALTLVPPAPAAQTFRAPIVPPTIDPGCDYASRDCAYSSYHAGIDYLGDDPPREVVRATADGVVRVAATTGESHGFGNAVILEHRRAAAVAASTRSTGISRRSRRSGSASA